MINVPFFSVINIFTFVNGNCAENNYTTQDLQNLLHLTSFLTQIQPYFNAMQ